MHTFVDPLSRAHKLFANRVAMVSGDVRLTYAETWSRCRRLAGALTQLGIQPGDRVAMLALNSHQYLEVYMTVPASGRVVVPLNTRHAEPELRYALEDSGTRVLITDRDPGALVHTVERVISLPDDYETLLATAPEAELGVGLTEDTLAGLFYTGGTTGASKGVMLSHRNLIANTTNWLIATQQGPEDTYLVMAPLFHAAGSLAVLATVWIGGCQGRGNPRAQKGEAMTFEEVLDQAIAMLQRRGRVTYRILQRQFQLDDDALNDLKDALLFAHPQMCDEAGRGLVWSGAPATAPTVDQPPASSQDRAPLSYTPTHLTEKILTSRATLAGERKQVTVLFADLKDSTELIRGLDPEAAQQLLDPAIHRMMDAVHRFEGTVNQVLGDGIMALFGPPIAHEDHALRACYAALAMQAAMCRYAEDVRRTQGVDIQIRVGLNSGEVVVRAISNDLHMDYSAVGQTTHLAARMEQLALPGSIRLTAATLRLVEGLVVQALGPVPIKGLPDPVEVFELVGASAIRRRLQAAVVRGLTRFVGRQSELVVLHQTLEQAHAGHGQVVALDAALQETLPALLALLDALPEDSPFLKLDPPQRRRRTLEALKRVLLRESQVQPLLLVFEDLHWIDSETQALLDSLVESLPTARLLLLVNYRPEYQHGWGSKTYYTQLRLDPLPPASRVPRHSSQRCSGAMRV